MSIIIGNGMCITYNETEVVCPICTFKFDAGGKIEKAKYPTFKTKCPACKGKIGISTPIYSGNTTCFEWDVPKSVKRLETITPNKINGYEIPIR
jgi:hypothetical protein